jgi:hypothetical protein
MGVSVIDGLYNRSHYNAELSASFEVLFDSAEFDDSYIDEGFRPDYDHNFSHNQNNIIYVNS